MSKTVIHVDDDYEIRTFVKMILEKEGYTCLCFETIEEAEEPIINGNPDLVILDVMVEEIDSGLKSYQNLRETCPETPIMFLTSLGVEIQPYFDMMGEKSVYILEKPVDPERLLSAVKFKIK